MNGGTECCDGGAVDDSAGAFAVAGAVDGAWCTGREVMLVVEVKILGMWCFVVAWWLPIVDFFLDTFRWHALT